MQPDRVPNRSNEPARSNAPLRIAPAEAPAGVPVLPTIERPRRTRRRGPINPVYLLLLTLLPLLMLAIMVWAAAALFPRSTSPRVQPTAVITPGNALAENVQASYDPNGATYRREGDIVYVTGTVKNNTDTTLLNITLKAFLYNGPEDNKTLVGSGIGWALGDIAPGASAPFTVTAQLSSGPVPGAGTPTPPPEAFNSVRVLADQVQVVPTPTPATTPTP
jgi:hypothetical protein